jgi:hypothetical protein
MTRGSKENYINAAINYAWNEPSQTSTGGEAYLTIVFGTGLKTLPPFIESI